MELEELKNKVKDFETKAGFDKTSFSDFIPMFEEEIEILKNVESNKSKVDHQLTDLLILVMQIAYRYETDFNKELADWFEKSKKYYK